MSDDNRDFIERADSITENLYGEPLPAERIAENFALYGLKRRVAALERFDISLGTGLAKLGGKVFRIGHLGDLNDLTLMGTLAGVEMGLALAGVPHRPGGVQEAMKYLVSSPQS